MSNKEKPQRTGWRFQSKKTEAGKPLILPADLWTSQGKTQETKWRRTADIHKPSNTVYVQTEANVAKNQHPIVSRQLQRFHQDGTTSGCSQTFIEVVIIHVDIRFTFTDILQGFHIISPFSFPAPQKSQKVFYIFCCVSVLEIYCTGRIFMLMLFRE